MKTTILTLLIGVSSIIAFEAEAQKGDKKEQQLKEKQRSERARSLGGQRTQSDVEEIRDAPKASERDAKADTTGSADRSSAGEVIPRNDDQPKANTQVNAPAVIQRTSSESGSPAVLSEDNGEGRDGTNNVQRAKPNIAGADEVGNMNLQKNNSGSRNTKLNERIQQQEERPQTDLSKREQKQDQQTVQKQAAQDRQSGERVAPATNDESSKNRKERKKSRRKKDKDSGR